MMPAQNAGDPGSIPFESLKFSVHKATVAVTFVLKFSISASVSVKESLKNITLPQTSFAGGNNVQSM